MNTAASRLIVVLATAGLLASLAVVDDEIAGAQGSSITGPLRS
jgi:hypothetical protein